MESSDDVTGLFDSLVKFLDKGYVPPSSEAPEDEAQERSASDEG